jgi:hypothetical protein
MNRLLALGSIFLMSACGAPTGDSASDPTIGGKADLVDTVSITRRSDGTFDVRCRDGRSEVDTQAQILANDVCVPPNNPGGDHTVNGSDASFTLPNSVSAAAVMTWGRGLWEGYMSFTAQGGGNEFGNRDYAYLKDATGATFNITAANVRFDRLLLPVSLYATTDSSVNSVVYLTQVSYEITQVNPIAASSLTGQFQVSTSPQLLNTVAADIPGVTLSLRVDATFYNNYLDGNRCSQITVNGTAVTPATASQTIQTTAPLNIYAAPSCLSSRLAHPENASADYAVAISSIQIGDPR